MRSCLCENLAGSLGPLEYESTYIVIGKAISHKVTASAGKS